MILPRSRWITTGKVVICVSTLVSLALAFAGTTNEYHALAPWVPAAALAYYIIEAPLAILAITWEHGEELPLGWKVLGPPYCLIWLAFGIFVAWPKHLHN